MDGSCARVSEAFSRQAPVFDALDEAPLIQWVRERVRAAIRPHLPAGGDLLEINCGTGIDSLWFAARGLRVTATDDAPGMLAELERKCAGHPGLPLAMRRCSFLALDTLAPATFDAVFSNFGGINCTAELDTVLRGIDARLRPGGLCALVIMPRFSPWELADLFRGNIGFALRRYRRKGTAAQVEGVGFTCWYHDVRAVRRGLPGYAMVDRMALSFFVPPPHLGPFAADRPRLVRWLEALERATCRWPFIRSRGDHYLLILRKPA